MQNINFWIGILGSLILVAGAAYPIEKVTSPIKSKKNWLFAVGGLFMLTYSIINYMQGGPIFFVMLQILVNISSILMMLNTPDKFDVSILSIAGIALIIWALNLFEGYNTVFFIIGLLGIGIGYALNGGTVKRNLALTVGSALIAIFSYIEASWIFFWLNVFFALFSGYYVLILAMAKRSINKQR